MTTIDQHRLSRPVTVAQDEPRPSEAYAAAAPPGEPSEPGMAEMLGRLHLMMRGKYLVSIFAAILMAGGFGYLGFRQGEQTYRSVGQIRIVPTLPRIMYETEDKGVMPMFDSFVQTQVSLMRTQRVIEIALEDRSWPSPPARDDASIAAFNRQLNVTRDNELIAVTFDAKDPAFAQGAVKAVIAAYRKLYIEADGRENEQVINQLTQRQAALNNDMAANRLRIRAIAERYNTDDIDDIFTDQQLRVATAEKALGIAKEFQSNSTVGGKSIDGDSPQALAAAGDRTLGRLLDEQATADATVDRMKAQGFGDNYPPMKKALQDADYVDKQIKERVATLAGTGAGGGQAAKLMADRIAKLTDDVTTQQQVLKSIGQDRFQLVDLKREAAAIEEKLGQTKRRLEELSTEAPVATGRITVISDGDRPLAPAKDTRRTFAAGAGFLGFCLPFGLSLLLASANRKYTVPTEARMSSITRDLVLGALPAVAEDVFDAEASTVAAHCLHQVRTMLQIRCNGHAKAIAITSARAGSGKTSVVLGLGVSYAMAGSKTLLIDLDLVGGGLTRRTEIEARTRLGSLLIEQGLVTEEQLCETLRIAKEKQIKLGEALLDAGYLRRDQLDAILELQKRSHAGLMDALYGSSIEDCITKTDMAGLDILPLGAASPRDAATLSPSEIKSLIAEAKTLYDTVLIDTGPVPGSLEASMVASLTDGVLMVVSRGEPRAGAESSLEHLRRVGGRVVGLVFNRARPSDAGLVAGSTYNGGNSLRAPGDRRPPHAARQTASTRFGPVGQAVLDLAPSVAT